MPVLIVDDNFTNRRVLQEILNQWGMRPTAVEEGRAALQALETARRTGRPFPLILLDGQMPEMDGFTLAELIQKDPELVGAAIMMLTSGGHAGDARAGDDYRFRICLGNVLRPHNSGAGQQNRERCAEKKRGFRF